MYFFFFFPIHSSSAKGHGYVIMEIQFLCVYDHFTVIKGCVLVLILPGGGHSWPWPWPWPGDLECGNLDASLIY